MSETQLYNLAQMRELAADIDAENKKIKLCIDQMLDTSGELRAVWQDEAQEIFRERYEALMLETRDIYLSLPGLVEKANVQANLVEEQTGGPV